MVEAPTPHADYDRYRQVLAEQVRLAPGEWWFKSNPAYRQILEHVTAEQAGWFIGCAEAEFPGIWPDVWALLPEIARANDSLGKPKSEPIARLGVECSPSNLRYMWHALIMLQQIDDLGEDAVHIVELGGGYGGLALYVQRLGHLFRTEIRSYTIVDVPEACAMQAGVAAELGVRLRVANGLDGGDLAKAVLPADGLQRFFFSAYGFSEFRRPLQDWYADRLVRHCQHGLLVWNYDVYWNNPVHQFVEGSITVENERPLIAPGNRFVSF